MLKRLPLTYDTTSFNLIGNVVSEHTAAACDTAASAGRDRTGKDIGLEVLVNSGSLPIPFPTAKGGKVSVVCDVYIEDEEYGTYTLDGTGEYDFTVLRSEVYNADTDWIQKVTIKPIDTTNVLVPALGGTVILESPATPAFLLSSVIRNIMPSILTSISFTSTGFTFSWEDYDEITVGAGVAYDSTSNSLIVLEEDQVVEVDFDLITDGGEITAAVYIDTSNGTVELEYGTEAEEGASTVVMPVGDYIIPLGYITFTVDEYGEGVISGAEVYSA